MQPPDGWIFREGTHDSEIWRTCCTCDEYGVRDRKFHATDLIVDIGCHTGSFSWLAYQSGSRNIEAYEANTVNSWIAKTNLHVVASTNVDVYCKAVMGNHLTAPVYPYFQPSADPANTGGGDIFGSKGKPVQIWRLDQILRGRPCRLLKLDCEGSEFSILCGSDLSSIEEIVGEYHEMGVGTWHEATKPIPEWAAIPGLTSWTRDVLKDHLERNGFEVEINHELEHIGKLFAKRKGMISRA